MIDCSRTFAFSEICLVGQLFFLVSVRLDAWWPVEAGRTACEPRYATANPEVCVDVDTDEQTDALMLSCEDVALEV